MSYYRYAVLNKDRTPEARAQNAKWLGPRTLGIEVTSKDLARECQLGNIDPQHNSDGHSSAIEEALVCPLPPKGTILVTIRPDKDSIGAMAILTLRAFALYHKIDHEFVRWIGALDRHGRQNVRQYEPELYAQFVKDRRDKALNAITMAKRSGLTVFDKVNLVIGVLINTMPPKDLRSWTNIRPAAPDANTYQVEQVGSLVVVKTAGFLKRVRDWANQRYPVALIVDSGDGDVACRFSVVRQPGNFDRKGFEQSVNSAEAQARSLSVSDLRSAGLDWGGPVNIVSSPSGAGRTTQLSLEQVLECVTRHAENGVVS